MSRLPTVGGDNDAWGTVLNDYLTKTCSFAALSASPSAGDGTVSIAATGPGFASGATILIDAFTTECEVRSISSISSGTITLDSDLKFAHNSGDVVLVVDDHLSAIWFGLTGDGSDEWAPLQRMFREATAYGGIEIRGNGGDTYYLGQPLLIPTGSRINGLTISSRTGFSPVDANGGLVCVGNKNYFFTATSSDNVITTPTDHGFVVSDIVLMCAPYGETFPTGMTQGAAYYVKSVPTSTTFTVSATSGGSTLDITADGAGWVVGPLGALSRIFWESFRVNLTIADLNGIVAGPQQPSWTRNLRVEMDAAASTQGGAIGASISGQLSYHDNVEINTSTNCTGLFVSGTGISIRGFNCNGVNDGDTGILIEGGRHSVCDIWTEQCGHAGVEINDTSMKGLYFGGYWLVSSSSPTTAPVLLVSSESGYTWDAVLRCTSNTQLIMNDTARSISLSGSGEMDSNNVFFGMIQAAGGVGPVLNWQGSQFSSATSVTANRSDKFVKVDASAASSTVHLPTAVGWTGQVYTIKHSGSANTVTIDPNSTETIDGSSTKSLAAGEFTTILSDGANWHTVG